MTGFAGGRSCDFFTGTCQGKYLQGFFPGASVSPEEAILSLAQGISCLEYQKTRWKIRTKEPGKGSLSAQDLDFPAFGREPHPYLLCATASGRKNPLWFSVFSYFRVGLGAVVASLLAGRQRKARDLLAPSTDFQTSSVFSSNLTSAFWGTCTSSS